jgi:hypothetical protein
MVTMVWVVGRLRLRTPLALHLHVSPLTSSGRSNRTSWASQPKKSVTLRHRQRADHEVQENMCWHWGGGDYLLTSNINTPNLVVSSFASSSGYPGIFLNTVYPEGTPVFLSPSWQMPN